MRIFFELFDWKYNNLTLYAATQLQGKAGMMNRKNPDKPMTMKMPDKSPQSKEKKVKKAAKSTMKCGAGKCGSN